MSSRPSRRRIKRLGVGLIAVLMVLMAVGSVAAHTGSPSAITVSQTSGLSVQASGTWTWPAEASASTLSYVGYAIDWGDVTSGNVIGSYHIGDGTSATNVILQPTSPAQGSSGSWGPVSHTYATAGTYTVCVIIYDLGPTKPFATTGYHSTQAAGTNHNTDNSVDHHAQVPAICGPVVVNVATPTPTVATTPPPSPTSVVTATPTAGTTSGPSATPTPFESFQGETFTPPPTGTGAPPQSPDQGVPTLALILLSGSALAALFVVKTAKVNR